MTSIHLAPLTIAQQGLWYLCRADERASAAYNMVFSFDASTPVDVERLKRAISQVAGRHELLRASIRTDADVPRFAITKAEDWQPTTVRRVARPLDDVLLEEHQHLFDFETGPLWRMTVADTAQGAARGLAITLSHIIFDGASLSVLLNDLASAGACEAERAPVPTTDCARIAAQEAAFVASPQGRQILRTTLQRLEGIPDRLVMPGATVRREPPPAMPAARHEFRIDASLREAVARAARQWRVTDVAVYLSALAIVLARHCGQEDFGISIPVANREGPGAESVIGYLANLAVVRARVPGRQTVDQLVVDMQDQLFDVLEASALPFPLVAKGLKRIGQSLHGPLLQVGFGHAGREASSTRWNNTSLVQRPCVPVYAKNELKLDLQEDDAGVRAWLLFDRDGFRPAWIEQLGRSYLAALAAMTQAPAGVRVGAMDVLDPLDCARLAQSWSVAGRPAATRQVHELFELHAARAPTQAAVHCDDMTWSYGELNARANRLAHRLRGMGVGPDVLVGVCMERGLDTCVGILAILKAGGAYLPMDPDYPRQRLAWMLEDANVRVLLTHSRLEGQVPASAAQVLCLDRLDLGASAPEPHTDVPGTGSPDDLIYCIYTSGSTGRPKAAANTHRGFAGLAQWYFEDTMGPASGMRVLVASSLSFDLTQKNLLGALAQGATVVLPSGPTADASALERAIQLHRPQRLNCAPSAFRLFGSATDLSSVREVILGGEPIDSRLVAQLDAAGARLVNSYGPTECADVAIAHEHRADGAGANVPLGRPIPGVRVYLIDADCRLVPPGSTGEVCIAGDGVGRGYLNRPDLTAERFVPDPFGPAGSRMYRTGDLARLTIDGDLEFLGRNDHQVKIRGQRIELGEVEAAIASLEGVRESIVTVHQAAGVDVLAAYVRAGDGVDLECVRLQLTRLLPAAMVPTSWVRVAEWPLSPNGKIDRQALPALHSVPQPASARTAPRTPTETYLTELWAEVLGHADFGVDDNFFELGGHSLLATQVTVRLRDRFAVSVGLRDLFECPTVATLARRLEERVKAGSVATQTPPPVRALARRYADS